MQIPLSSLGVNSISGKFEQAGLSAAVLVELRERYKVRFNEEISHKIGYAYDSTEEPCINDKIKQGIYKQGKSYITLKLCNGTPGFILNI